MPPTSRPQALPEHPNCDDLIKALVEWIHISPFVRQFQYGGVIQNRPGAVHGRGWDFRIQEYAYARSRAVSFPCVYAQTGPVIARLATIVTHYNWPTVLNADVIAPADLRQLEQDAEWICNTWGGVRNRDFPSTWEVVKSAVTGAQHDGAPMNSGWTKVASFVTDRLPNSQTIWDSRVSTSVIWRIDELLHGNHLLPTAFPCLANLRVVLGRGGTRPRPLHNDWPDGSCTWPAHFAGSEIVRKIVKILNNPAHGYPRIPQPNGDAKKWDVFGVGLVLFMDGY